MTIEEEFNEALCESCGQPLFLSKEECRKFIEKKAKQGHIVCRCCGVKQETNQEEGLVHSSDN